VDGETVLSVLRRRHGSVPAGHSSCLRYGIQTGYMPSHPPLQSPPVLFPRSGRSLKLTTHIHLVSTLKMRGVIPPPLPTKVFKAWCFIKALGRPPVIARAPEMQFRGIRVNMSTIIRRDLNVFSRREKIKECQQNYFEQVIRMLAYRIPRNMFDYCPKGRRDRGRPLKKWKDQFA
jgi:hypothetical protein